MTLECRFEWEKDYKSLDWSIYKVKEKTKSGSLKEGEERRHDT